MCGRFAFFQRPAEIRHQLQQSGVPVDEIRGEESVRQSYNFAPGYNGLVYRAAVPDSGASEHDGKPNDKKHSVQKTEGSRLKSEITSSETTGEESDQKQEYVLQSMRWGLIPFWTKRKPEYGSLMRTINCRDDSLIEDRGMWTSMKRKKRCMVICNGFYEWLKKNNGKERIPHYIKRKDNNLMCLAGLWDCAQYEGETEKLYTFTIITTDSNEQLKFLHNRMPVIFEPWSEEMQIWLDPSSAGWNKRLQSFLKPYEGELEIYQVQKEVGKVGNDSPDFIVPLDSSSNKSNIANFFGGQRKHGGEKGGKNMRVAHNKHKNDDSDIQALPDKRETTPTHTTESNAPLPASAQTPSKTKETIAGIKRERNYEDDDNIEEKSPSQAKMIKTEHGEDAKSSVIIPASSPRKLRSQNANKGNPVKQSPRKDVSSKKITSFFEAS